MHIMYVLRARHRTYGKTLGQLIDIPHFPQRQPKKLKHLNLCSTHPGPIQRHSNRDDRRQWCSSVSFPFRSIPALALHLPVAKRPTCHLLQAATWMVFAQSERARPDSCECFSFPGASLSSGARLTVRACPGLNWSRLSKRLCTIQATRTTSNHLQDMITQWPAAHMEQQIREDEKIGPLFPGVGPHPTLGTYYNVLRRYHVS